MTFHIQRLYKGQATLRSDQIQKAVQRGEDILIDCNGEQMTIPNKDIESSIINKSAPMPSKFNVGTSYQLCDFLWIPTA